MSLFPYKRERFGRGASIMVDKRHRPLYFDISNSPDLEIVMNNFVEYGTPGTGFFERNASSHHYREFVEQVRLNYSESVVGYMMGNRFDYDEEIARAKEAASKANHPIAKHILECYASMLPLAEQAEECRRRVQAVRKQGDLIPAALNTVQKESKSAYRNLTRQAKLVRYNVAEMCPREQYESFLRVHAVFVELMESRQLLHRTTDPETMENRFNRVLFDLAVFDYIAMPVHTPMMRDTFGNGYFIYPTFVVKAASSTEIEVFDMKNLHFCYHEVAHDQVSESVTVRESGDSVSHRRNYAGFGAGLLVKQRDDLLEEAYDTDQHQRVHVVAVLSIPELGLEFYSQDIHRVHHFYKAINEYQQTYFTEEEKEG